MRGYPLVDPRLNGRGSPFQVQERGVQEKSARRPTQPMIPVIIAMMKPIAPSQSKSPASVPRLAERSGSMLLYMMGLWSTAGHH